MHARRNVARESSGQQQHQQNCRRLCNLCKEREILIFVALRKDPGTNKLSMWAVALSICLWCRSNWSLINASWAPTGWIQTGNVQSIIIIWTNWFRCRRRTKRRHACREHGHISRIYNQRDLPSCFIKKIHIGPIHQQMFECIVVGILGHGCNYEQYKTNTRPYKKTAKDIKHQLIRCKKKKTLPYQSWHGAQKQKWSHRNTGWTDRHQEKRGASTSAFGMLP